MHTHCISQKCIIYIPSIYNVYTSHVLYIYTWYIQVYTKDKPYSIYHEYSWNITGISEIDLYMHVFTWYIPGIFL